MTTLVALAGGPKESREREPVATGSLKWRYPALPPEGGYRVLVAARRLTAVIEQTEDGYVASCPELETLGYGEDVAAAFADLVGATMEYLTILAEDSPPLAPRVAHHAEYMSLLRVPVGAWFAAIGGLTTSGPDAT